MQYWNKKKLGIAAVVAVIVLAGIWLVWPSRASAADLGEGPLIPGIAATKAAPWTGIYLGAGLGYQVADTNLTLDAASPGFTGNIVEIDGLSGRGWGYDGRLGVDWQIPNTAFVIGILGGYAGGETEFNVNSDLPFGPKGAPLGNVLNATMEQSWYAGGRLGIAHKNVLVYGGYAWTRGDFNVSIPASPGLCSAALPVGMSLTCSQDVGGRMILAGIEVLINPQLSLGAEYTLAQYDTANIFSAVSGPNSLSLDADTDVHAFKVRLNFRPFSK